MKVGVWSGGLTHRSIGALAQLLQLLERAGMSFAIHVEDASFSEL